MRNSEAYSLEYMEKLSSLTRAKSFLGREFLTWLWYRSETCDQEVPVRDLVTGKAKSVHVWVDDRLTLESAYGETQGLALKGGSPSASLEATAALLAGKSAKELKVGIRLTKFGDFSANIGSVDLNPRGLKLPPVPEELAEAGHPEALNAGRILQTEAFLEALDELFSAFLDERVNESWESQQMIQIREWIKQRDSRGDSLLH